MDHVTWWKTMRNTLVKDMTKTKKILFFRKFHNWAWIQMPKNDNAFIFLDSCISRLSFVILLMFGINFRLFFLIKLTSSRLETIRYCISNFDRLVVNNYDSTDWYSDRKYEIICVWKYEIIWDAIACKYETENRISHWNDELSNRDKADIELRERKKSCQFSKFVFVLIS